MEIRRSIYNTRSNIIAPELGVVTVNAFICTYFMPISEIVLPFTDKVTVVLNEGSKITLKRINGNWQLTIPPAAKEERIDYVIEIRKITAKSSEIPPFISEHSFITTTNKKNLDNFATQVFIRI